LFSFCQKYEIYHYKPDTFNKSYYKIVDSLFFLILPDQRSNRPESLRMQSTISNILFFTLIVLSTTIISCNKRNHRPAPKPTPTATSTASATVTATATAANPWSFEGISDLRQGDIIVIPNINIFPGTSQIPNGYSFGHAAFVTSGYEHENPDSLLAHTMIIESIASKVPVGFQIREIQGYFEHESLIYNSNRFGPELAGIRYRLRYDFTESQIDSIIHFLRDQKNDLSNWNATKRFPYSKVSGHSDIDTTSNWADNSHWYCSLLIWQSVLYVTGIDLDPNAGYYIYPNDLINSEHFDNTDDKIRRRVTF